MNPLTPPTFQGYFWLPETPDTRVSGRFSCTDEGKLELDILGTFSGAQIELDQAPLSRILGVSEKGKFVTLENCFYSEHKINFAGLAVSKIRVNLAFVGCHFEKEEPIYFDEIVCYSEAINDWFEFAPIEASLTTGEPSCVLTLSYSQPAPLEWALTNGVRMKIRSCWQMPVGTKYREAQITQKTWVGFKFDKETSLDDLLSIANRFCHFVSFVVDETIPWNAIVCYSKGLIGEIADKKSPVQIQVFYSPDTETSPDLMRVTGPFPLFSFPSVRDRFGSLISTWFDNYETCNSSFNLYFATKTGRALYLDNRFLMLAQALESLHRHSSNETSMCQEEYAKLCNVLNNAVPDQFKDWLTQRLKYGNEISLRQRLKCLFRSFDSVYGDNKQVKELISRIVDTRNYLTHFDESLRERSARGKDLWRLCSSIETLFQLHMATMCGLSTDEVIDLCKRSQSFKRKIAEI